MWSSRQRVKLSTEDKGGSKVRTKHLYIPNKFIIFDVIANMWTVVVYNHKYRLPK